MTLLDRLVPSVGDVILNRYELVHELGRGGFGIVFRARQRGLDEDVAIKLLLPQLVVNKEVFSRFEREVKVAKRLRHPNSVRILDCGQTPEGLPFYVMEYVKGDPLDDKLANEGQLSASRARQIVAQILKSLAEAHSHDVVHRDLKPANIMLSEIFGERDFVKVLDFGIAKALTEPDGATNQTATGMILGTPAYMSPEQAFGMREIDGRSDIYAVGLILAECVTGQQVVRGETPMVLLAQHASKEPLRFPQELKASPLWPIINQATQKPREFRFRDATEMREALEQMGKLPTTDLMLGKPVSDLYESIEDWDPTTPTEPMSDSDRLTRPAIFSAESEAESGQQTPDAQSIDKKRRSQLSIALLAFLLVAVVGAVAAVVSFGPTGEGSTSADARAEPLSPEIIENGSGEAATVGEVATQTTEEPNAEPAELPAETPTEPPSDTNNVMNRTAFVTTMAIAADRLRQAIPSTHRVRFEGTDDVRVSLDGQLLGVTPFEGVLPRIGHSMDLHYERSGYRSSNESVSMLNDVVEVELRRRRTPRPTPETPPEPETVTVPAPFGNAPIDNR